MLFREDVSLAGSSAESKVGAHTGGWGLLLSPFHLFLGCQRRAGGAGRPRGFQRGPGCHLSPHIPNPDTAPVGRMGLEQGCPAGPLLRAEGAPPAPGTARPSRGAGGRQESKVPQEQHTDSSTLPLRESVGSSLASLN